MRGVTTATPWTHAVGTRITRADLQKAYGGSTQGGITPSGTTANIMLFSDPARGLNFGYSFDGWTEDGQHFLYTGDGQVGDQVLTYRNRAVSTHGDGGRALRLLIAVDHVPGTKTQIHEYIGQFDLDPALPFVRADAPDRNNDMRSVIVFRLRPIYATAATATEASATGDVATTTRRALIPLEAHQAEAFDIPASTASTAQRRESELVAAFTAHLISNGHTVRRWRLQPPGSLQPMLTDPYDETSNTLYEAKASATRSHVRMAVGQLLDYRRHIDRPGLRLAVLLPSRPTDDLLNLMQSIGAACTWPTGAGYETADN